jgi:hypothetical protein
VRNWRKATNICRPLLRRHFVWINIV